ncbi:hypothetical protein GobsT_21890 [Gemmata obscuriglobus]|uniref:Uncharacterized protein n=1 Tax=Gemmata obscuriglobus TaxID=114 RepID=A0A2Z3H3P9_9BACT|nr:hypothetical protein [Gemmata obscuriglobus]AWM39481.1 hypothetical protein C1280_22465 [Gemmata obscuriglobus]QEG27433.1 hypothetical protein GobsT_21890 [Gemmata obscuriglobus]VTS04385.1 Uncharacterized protein OS=Singulisphaera acidiphila (strain ATCC BAA-1392 / DSM 18658 / VKM B-2454 / MOB10) GN=Sinac_1894 PE=4 SV=1 [Gemmata obscuriglobus UQM 2246]
MYDPAEPAPALGGAALDKLTATLAAHGPAAAVDELIAELRAAEDFQGLFYALLMKARIGLGVSPFPTGAAGDLPAHTHAPYEDAIRAAARHVGGLLLERKEFSKAWAFFRMLDEPEPVRAALAAYAPGPDDDVYPVIEVAWQGGVLPKKGFDLVLDRHGICSAITMVSGSDLGANADLRDYCVARLATALHAQLTERLTSDLTARGVALTEPLPVARLVELHPDLFAEDAYHIDTSHLSSVVQMSTHLAPGPALDCARGLCAYGRKLAPNLQGHNDAPFEENYDDYLAYLNVIAGEQVEEGLARFAAKAAREAAEGATYAAQVYVNLLLKAGRSRDALNAAKQFLLAEDDRNLICPGVNELARRVGDYGALADAAKSRGDSVGFLASLIAAKGGVIPNPA